MKREDVRAALVNARAKLARDAASWARACAEGEKKPPTVVILNATDLAKSELIEKFGQDDFDEGIECEECFGDCESEAECKACDGEGIVKIQHVLWSTP